MFFYKLFCNFIRPVSKITFSSLWATMITETVGEFDLFFFSFLFLKTLPNNFSEQEYPPIAHTIINAEIINKIEQIIPFTLS